MPAFGRDPLGGSKRRPVDSNSRGKGRPRNTPRPRARAFFRIHVNTSSFPTAVGFGHCRFAYHFTCDAEERCLLGSVSAAPPYNVSVYNVAGLCILPCLSLNVSCFVPAPPVFLNWIYMFQQESSQVKSSQVRLGYPLIVSELPARRAAAAA